MRCASANRGLRSSAPPTGQTNEQLRRWLPEGADLDVGAVRLSITERDSVRFGDTTIDYRIRRSERRKKTVQITVDGNGVEVASPATTSSDELRGIVRKRAPWIVTHSTGQTLEAAPKRFVSGETLPGLGHDVQELAGIVFVLLRLGH
ncbi:MAG: DUF45 domain-containing protein [bacterium]|nr:DUF45 domain-containing protein [bacterium]